MRNYVWAGAALLLLGIVLGAVVSAGIAFAEDDDPSTPPEGHGRWGTRHGGSMAQGWMAVDSEALHEAHADALGISVQDLLAARSEGKTLLQLAEAVAQGRITQEQANWMLERRAAGFAPGHGNGECDGDGPVGGAFGPGPRGRFRVQTSP